MEKIILVLITTVAIVACNSERQHDKDHHHNETEKVHQKEEAHHHHNDSHHHDEDEHHNEAESHSDEIVLSEAVAKQIGVESQIIIAQDFKSTIYTSGVILPSTTGQVALVAKASGIIHFTNGKVTKGIELQANQEIARLTTQGLVSQNAVDAAHNNYLLAKKEYERAEELVKENIISQKEFQRIESEYLLAQKQVSGLNNSNEISIFSPNTAYLEDIYVNEGEFVNEGDVVAKLFIKGKSLLKVNLPQNCYNNKHTYSDADFKFNDNILNIKQLNGKLVSVSNSLESSYLPLFFEFDNKNLPNNAFVEVWLQTDNRENVLSLPLSAITEEQGNYFIYIQLDEDCYSKRKVILGEKNAQKVEILSGLSEGEKVVVKGAYQVKLAKAAVIPGHTHNH